MTTAAKLSDIQKQPLIRPFSDREVWGSWIPRFSVNQQLEPFVHMQDKARGWRAMKGAREVLELGEALIDGRTRGNLKTGWYTQNCGEGVGS
uniref:Uncharacterized protein n=1 Tax=Moniliophthora roreri TaxID=221103 RepID=A0A0W0G4D6_MONRR